MKANLEIVKISTNDVVKTSVVKCKVKIPGVVPKN